MPNPTEPSQAVSIDDGYQFLSTHTPKRYYTTLSPLDVVGKHHSELYQILEAVKVKGKSEKLTGMYDRALANYTKALARCRKYLIDVPPPYLKIPR
jgi:hypothetical protein